MVWARYGCTELAMQFFFWWFLDLIAWYGVYKMSVIQGKFLLVKKLEIKKKKKISPLYYINEKKLYTRSRTRFAIVLSNSNFLISNSKVKKIIFDIGNSYIKKQTGTDRNRYNHIRS